MCGTYIAIYICLSSPTPSTPYPPTPPSPPPHTQKTPEWRRRALLVRALAMTVYWFYDNTCFFINVKLSTYDPVKALSRDGAAW